MQIRTSVTSGGERTQGLQQLTLDWENVADADKVGYLRQFVSHRNSNIAFIFTQSEAEQLIPLLGKASLPKKIPFEVVANYPRSAYHENRTRHTEEPDKIRLTLRAGLGSGYNGNSLFDVVPKNFFASFRDNFLLKK